MTELSRPMTLLVLVGMAWLVSACAAEPTLYRWGNYEEILYRPYKESGSIDAINDAIALAEDMARTEEEGRAVPPGVRVHLGFLYYSQGKANEARALFEQERELFPESTVFIDGLLQRMGSQ
jgi:hypothetical protein